MNATLVERLRDPNYWGSIVREEAAARIAELEAELDEITRRAVDDGAHDAIDASARMDEREATLALLDGMPDALARDIAATIRAMDEEPLPNRLAELEAANAICRRDIEALMSSCDKLEARNTELEAERDKLKAENDALVNNWASALAGDLVKAGENEFSSDPSGE
jgi:cell division protein FtsB